MERLSKRKEEICPLWEESEERRRKEEGSRMRMRPEERPTYSSLWE